MPSLDGCLVVARDVPSFVVPVLVDRPGSNLPLLQEIDQGNRVTSFFEVDVGNSYEQLDFKFEVDIGDQAIWGFRSLTGDVCVGTFDALKGELQDRLFSGEFGDFPLIETQISKFCNLSSSYASALSKSYQLMATRSKLGAEIWRDCSVLLPLAKKELAQAIPKRLSSELDHIRLIGSGNAILLELPSKIHEYITMAAYRPNLEETLKLGHVFGLTSYKMQASDAGPGVRDHTSSFDAPYGELVPFTSIGDLAAKNSPSFSTTRRLIPPWVKNNARPNQQSPLVTFCVINTDLKNIDSALRFAAHSSKETIKIAIVTSPITFGASRGHQQSMSLLDSLRPTFDYIFVVSNHVLQMPTGAAPRLAASSRAVQYVRACVDGVMQIVWAPAAPQTARDFYRIFPRQGFCIVGRATGNKSTAPRKLLQDALASALNEPLPLHQGQLLALVGPPAVVDNTDVVSFLQKADDITPAETLSVASTGRRAAATLLVFGIALAAQRERRFREFCLELIHHKNFSVTRKSLSVVFGEFAKGRTIAVGFATERTLNRVITEIKGSSIKTMCVLTNFKLETPGVEHYWSQGIAVFHYSLLDSYIKHQMSAPPRARWK